MAQHEIQEPRPWYVNGVRASEVGIEQDEIIAAGGGSERHTWWFMVSGWLPRPSDSAVRAAPGRYEDDTEGAVIVSAKGWRAE